MARTSKLSDLHYVLLATAAHRASGSLLPPSSSVKAVRATITRAIAALIRRGLAAEVATQDAKCLWREEDGRRMAAVITDSGRAALAIADGKEPEVAPAGSADDARPESPRASETPSSTKRAQLIALLQRDGGASIAMLTDALGWLPHTTRAALTGLRKKGHSITSQKRDGVRYYGLAA